MSIKYLCSRDKVQFLTKNGWRHILFQAICQHSAFEKQINKIWTGSWKKIDFLWYLSYNKKVPRTTFEFSADHPRRIQHSAHCNEKSFLRKSYFRTNPKVFWPGTYVLLFCFILVGAFILDNRCLDNRSAASICLPIFTCNYRNAHSLYIEVGKCFGRGYTLEAPSLYETY